MRYLHHHPPMLEPCLITQTHMQCQPWGLLRSVHSFCVTYSADRTLSGPLNRHAGFPTHHTSPSSSSHIGTLSQFPSTSTMPAAEISTFSPFVFCVVYSADRAPTGSLNRHSGFPTYHTSPSSSAHAGTMSYYPNIRSMPAVGTPTFGSFGLCHVFG
jgi:hypothetical protein